MYGVKLKGVSVCFTMLKAVLSGNYVNFGVFRLYGDDALDNALQTFIKLLLSIPHSDLLVCWCHSSTTQTRGPNSEFRGQNAAVVTPAQLLLVNRAVGHLQTPPSAQGAAWTLETQ